MKPLSELENNWRENANLKHDIAPHAAAQLLKCADLLQAWLREADTFAETQQVMSDATSKNFSSWGTANEAWTNAWMIMRQYLLGTTRPEGKK